MQCHSKSSNHRNSQSEYTCITMKHTLHIKEREHAHSFMIRYGVTTTKARHHLPITLEIIDMSGSWQYDNVIVNFVTIEFDTKLYTYITMKRTLQVKERECKFISCHHICEEVSTSIAIKQLKKQCSLKKSFIKNIQ